MDILDLLLLSGLHLTWISTAPPTWLASSFLPHGPSRLCGQSSCEGHLLLSPQWPHLFLGPAYPSQLCGSPGATIRHVSSLMGPAVDTAPSPLGRSSLEMGQGVSLFPGGRLQDTEELTFPGHGGGVALHQDRRDTGAKQLLDGHTQGTWRRVAPCLPKGRFSTFP